MLSLEDAAPYLLERQLIDPQWIIDGSLLIQSAVSKNANLKIEGPQGGGLLIKQPVDAADGSRETLGREAAFYQLCGQEPGAAAIKEIMPDLVHYDAKRCVIVLRLLPQAVTLSEYLAKAEEQLVPIDVASALGQALGTVHRVHSAAIHAPCSRPAWLPRAAPWVMAIHRPTPEVLSSLSPAGCELIRMLQTQTGCTSHLDSLHALWRVETIIHGDIRSGNVLVGRGRGESPWEVWVVDWEMVQLGDPAWDVAGALQAIARFWVDSMPMEADLSIDERAALARFPLERMQGLCRSLWQGYQAASDPARPESDLLLERAVSLSAVRMIQTAIEISGESMNVDPRSVIMLQLGANVLSEPEVARTELFGIPRPAP